MPLQKKTVWLDCDPGHDDAMAILLACHHPDCHLLGISTVAGNQSVEKTTRNAAAVLAAVGYPSVPVVRGQGRALMQPLQFCEEIHGNSGLDGPGGSLLFADGEVPVQNVPGVVLIDQAIKQHYHKTGQAIDLVCTGSLTNAALLLTLFPDVAPLIRLTLMGGAMGLGNTSPVAEFNLENDPEAARIVFESGVPLTMVPLEVTHTVLVRPDILEQIGYTTPFRRKMVEMLTFFKATYKTVFFFDDPPLHDPLAVWYVLRPEAFETRFLHVAIETTSALSRGQTVCDIFGRTGKAPNCQVAVRVDVDRFWVEMLEAVAQADEWVKHKPESR